MAGVLIIMIFIMFIIVFVIVFIIVFIIAFIIMFIIEHNLITDRATIDNITSQVLILNVYFSHWPVEATVAEAMWGIFGGGFFSVRCNMRPFLKLQKNTHDENIN